MKTHNLSVLSVVDLIISGRDTEVLEILEELSIKRSTKRKGKQVAQ
jgi:hypothetical protein